MCFILSIQKSLVKIDRLLKLSFYNGYACGCCDLCSIQTEVVIIVETEGVEQARAAALADTYGLHASLGQQSHVGQSRRTDRYREILVQPQL